MRRDLVLRCQLPPAARCAQVEARASIVARADRQSAAMRSFWRQISEKAARAGR